MKAQFAELATLVGDLLELARGDTATSRTSSCPCTRSSRPPWNGPGCAAPTVSTELSPWYVVGSATSLERAVLNLIDNAAKFSPGREVEVALREGVLTVRDHGPGIAEDELPHVFERFWRSPSARSLPGSGLGLAIVAQAAAEADGVVSLDNAAGGGTIATMRLPGRPQASG